MIDSINIDHHIQKYILSVLYHQKVARFRDMRPPKTDSNLYSYHLKILIKQKIVKKIDDGYTLDKKGLVYIDRVSTKSMMVRAQPKIVTMMVIQNSDGQVLLQKRIKQPFTDMWTLPYGKLHIEDETIEAAARREAKEKLSLENAPVEHAGDCYIRTFWDKEIFSSTLVHVFRFYEDNIEESDWLKWVKPHKLTDYDLAPAVEKIVARTFFKDPYFFEEFEEELIQ